VSACMAWHVLHTHTREYTAGGGRVFAGNDEQSARVRGVAEAVGRELGGIGTDVVLLAWLLRHPAQICPIVGSTNVCADARAGVGEPRQIALLHYRWAASRRSPRHARCR
jgi:predicted oxidoreductase